MTGTSQITRCNEFSMIWAALEKCGHKGIHVYDDPTGRMVYQSYADVALAAGRLANILKAQGIKQGQKILICAETTPNFPHLWLALLWLGATPVPMPPGWTLTGQYTFRERIRSIVAHFPYYLCGDAEEAEITAVATELQTPLRILPLSKLYAATTAECPPPVKARLQQRDIAFVQFTSGSTKAPKGIQITYANLYANAYAIWTRLAVDPEHDRSISWLPLYHDMGLVGKFLSCLLTQTPLILMSPQTFARRPLQFLVLAGEYRANYCCMPNFGYEWIIKRFNNSHVPDFSLQSLKWLGVGAEPANPATLESFEKLMRPYGLRPGVVSPCYGLAEATLAVSIAGPDVGYRVSRRGGDDYVTCGQVIADLDVRITGDGDDSGRILIRGESVAQTALVDGEEINLLDGEGYYDTKDIGYFDHDSLVVLGRYDEMFVINGENYFPYDIESITRNVKGVLRNRALCFFVPPQMSPIGKREIVVLYETSPLADQTNIKDEIEREIMRRTGLQVTNIINVPPRSIPVTPSGKLQRLRARSLYLEGFYYIAVDSTETIETAHA